MRDRDEPGRKREELPEHGALARASASTVGPSANLEGLLKEPLEGACALTGARGGAVVVLGEAGEASEVVTASLAADERRRLLERLRGLEVLPRPATVPVWADFLGPAGARAFLGVPIHHGPNAVGFVFLAEKEGGFTGDDEKLLRLLASQAGVAIACAQAQTATQRIRAELETLVETAPVGVAIFDAATGEMVSVNREGLRVVDGLRTPGHTITQMVEVATLRRADGRELDFAAVPFLEVLRGAEVVRAEEIVISVPGGRHVKLLVNCTPVCSADGNPTSVVVTLQDLAPIQELERLRAEFLGMVSHELRAPLTSIKGSATTLLETAPDLDPAEMRAFFRIIAGQADHMRGLISDLLDAGRIETGTLSVSPESSQLSALVDRARTTFLSGGGLHTVLIDLPPDLPRVMADRRRIVQVLNNLFTNAARHAPESSPIRVAALRDGVHVVVTVTDEGRGIAPERLAHLFQKYARTEDAGRELAGTGLGLAICKGLVEAHGGRIRAESDGIGQGARFTFTLPVAVPDAGSAGATDRRDPPRNEQERAPILVVDDDPETLRYVRKALTDADYAPLVTGDFREIAQIVRTKRPKLVVLDLMLPETDGIELMQTVPGLAEVPVIFISAYGRDETIARALEAGAADYIVKPFSATELSARIGAALRRRAEPEPFALGALCIHYDEHRVSVDGNPVELTASEYALLRALSINAGRVLDYRTLVRQVSGKKLDHDAKVALRALVKNLRRKLGDTGTEPNYILNQRGTGYRMPRPGGL